MIDAAGSISEWAESTRRRIIFPLEFAGWAAPQPIRGLENAQRPELRPYPTREIDSLVIVLPTGYTPEFLPWPVEVESELGRYNFNIHFADDTFTMVRNFEFFANRANRNAPEKKGDIHDAITALQYADAVFVREESADSVNSTGQPSGGASR